MWEQIKGRLFSSGYLIGGGCWDAYGTIYNCELVKDNVGILDKNLYFSL